MVTKEERGKKQTGKLGLTYASYYMQNWRRQWHPLQYSCLENPMDWGAWKAVVHGVAEGRTWLSNLTFTFHFHALDKEMATHSSVLAWRIPGMGKPGGLPSIGSHRIGHDWSNLAAAAYIKYITNRNLQFSTGNSSQYSVMTYMGIEAKNKSICICICINDLLCCIAGTNTTLQINYIHYIYIYIYICICIYIYTHIYIPTKLIKTHN